jgi:hypothetical protein
MVLRVIVIVRVMIVLLGCFLEVLLLARLAVSAL